MFVADRSILLAALDKAASVVDNAPINPIYECVLLVLDAGQLSITGSDGQVQVTARCAITEQKAIGDKKAKAKKSTPKSLAVNAKKFSKILRNTSVDEIAVELDGNSLSITSGSGHFLLAFQPGADFPQMEVGADNLTAELDQATLLRAIKRVQAAISNKVHRQFLAGAYFDFTKKGLQLVATDGHRLATDLLKIKTKSKEQSGFIVPRKAIYELGRILGDTDNQSLRLGAIKDGEVFRSASFETADVCLIAQLIVATYPDYRRVIPDLEKNKQQLIFDRLNLLTAVRQACTVHDRVGEAVKMITNGSNQVTLKAESLRQKDQAQVRIGLENENDVELQTSINSTYLQDMLNAFEGFPKINFAFSDGEGSILCLPADTKDSQLQYVVMPVR